MLKSSIPILPTADPAAIQAFCREKLGFTVDHGYPDYVIASRDGVALHFTTVPHPQVAAWTACYLDLDDVEALYREYAAAGIVHPNGHLEAKPWGMREFTALTPDGVALRIGQAIAL